MAKTALIIPFFNDYGLWATVEMEATSRGISMPVMVMKIVGSKSNPPVEIKNTKHFYGVCKEQSTKVNESVAVFIEHCCRDFLNGDAKSKPKWWELPRK